MVGRQDRGFPRDSVGKESACNAGDPGSIPGQEDPLEKEMATNSSTLARRIPWIEELGRLQSMGLQRVGHDCVTNFHFSVFQKQDKRQRKKNTSK